MFSRMSQSNALAPCIFQSVGQSPPFFLSLLMCHSSRLPCYSSLSNELVFISVPQVWRPQVTTTLEVLLEQSREHRLLISHVLDALMRLYHQRLCLSITSHMTAVIFFQFIELNPKSLSCLQCLPNLLILIYPPLLAGINSSCVTFPIDLCHFVPSSQNTPMVAYFKTKCLKRGSSFTLLLLLFLKYFQILPAL